MNKKKIAISQSNYIPWKGYFDMIASVDEFIVYDDMQYTRRDWRNRNLIKTPQGVKWLTIPVIVKGKFDQKIRDVKIDEVDWEKNHWKSIVHNYQGSPYFSEISLWLEPMYLKNPHKNLSELNIAFLRSINQYLGIATKISASWDYGLVEGKSERLLDLCKKSGGAEYVSGPSARNYLDPTIFAKNGIKLTWLNHDGYPEYKQRWGDYVHGVSILDLIFNCGPQSANFMKNVIK